MRAWVLILLACGCRSQPRPDAGAEKVAVEAAAAAVIVDAAPAPIHVTVARFGVNGVDECTDLDVMTSREVDAAAFKMENTTLLPQPCNEAFSDRPELARCETHTNADGGSISATSRYYDAIELDDDQYMKECFEMGGKWHALRKDSPEFARSRLRGHAKQLKNLAP
jgi:hypothetical protein